ncbi:MAG: DUF177 domain-containing protein [Bacteroidaceae bacterium]|nr:DUF177 domain-containing protein [Bacteroidaceae bacterium]
MEKLDSYKVDLKGMSEGTVSYSWHVEDNFFSAVQGPEIQQGQLDVALRVKRMAGAYELVFQLEGTVKVLCDRCLDWMDCPISAEHVLRAKLGDEYADDGDLIIVPEDDGLLNVAWNIYEFAALEIPLRHVHAEGTCSQQMTDAIASLSSAGEEEKPVDPRWSALEKLRRKSEE